MAHFKDRVFEADIRRMYIDESASLQQIATVYSVDSTTVRLYLITQGIPMRTRAEGTRASFERGDRPTRTVTVPLREELFCRGCGGHWQHTDNSVKTNCPHCGKSKDARDRHLSVKSSDKSEERKEGLKQWLADPANRKAKSKKDYVLQRKRIFFRLSGSIHPRCVRCGCDDTRLLEINHKNGGGHQEVEQGRKSQAFHHAIAVGKRAVDDLELLCRPCNALHYLELLHGPLPMQVVWKGNASEESD